MARMSLAKRKVITSPQIMRASYDSARTTTDNATLWTYTDALSAARSNSPAVRKVLRERARYEIANNSYGDGIVDTLVSDLIGAWVTIKLGESAIAKQAEQDFQKWALASRFWQKLHAMIRAQIVDGESFALMTTNRNIRHAVKLNIIPFECDMCESYWNMPDVNEIDGIRFDENKDPVAYRILGSHPGDYRVNLKSKAGEWVDSRFIIHFFNCLRPGQVRGVSELTPALPLFAQLRSYTVSVLEAAARAAEVAGVIYTDLVPNSDDGECAADVEAGSTIPAGRNKIVSLPEGWKLEQMKAEQPTTTYPMFKREIIGEIARCQSMPFNVAACDSSSYNYASGRLDHQTYDRYIDVKRFFASTEILDRVWEAYLQEYAPLKRLTPAQVEEISVAEWFFTSRDHVDPGKEASADDTRLKNGTLTRSSYYAKKGFDGTSEMHKWVSEEVALLKLWKEELKRQGLPENTPMPGSAYQQQQAQQPNQTEKSNAKQDTEDE